MVINKHSDNLIIFMLSAFFRQRKHENGTDARGKHKPRRRAQSFSHRNAKKH